MKIGVFSVKKYDREFLSAANGSRHELRFFELHLNEESAGLAAGFEAVCVFVNDQVNAAVIARLHSLGMRLFHSPEEIWEEIRGVWKAGHGITYARLEKGGLQWPCPTEDHPGTTVLHKKSFPSGARAPLKRIEFAASEETTSSEFPFLLTTGRTLYQFNAGTMTMRTPNVELRSSDTLDVSAEDAARLELSDGEPVRVRAVVTAKSSCQFESKRR